jgi:eukaryotic-like serine/threonine-protein kinase
MPNCPDDVPTSRLRRLFDEELSEAEQAEMAAHLERCPECCRRLDRMAARSGYWRDLRLLKEEDEYERRSSIEDEESGGDHHDAPVVPPGLLEPASEPAHLGRLGPYDILGVVGRGGMGIVFQARDRSLDRLVAIKVLTPGLASTAAARRRFAREAKAAAAVVNEHVVAIHAVDTTLQGVPYLVMQYVDGKSVQDLIDQGEPPQVRQILRIGMQAAQALAAAHAQGLIHRDVKPANILLENGLERVKITDFGLARAVDDATMTQPGIVAGTPRYMAPEQARGDAIDHRADLFSLGSVLYALCTGRAPFLGTSSVATLKSVCDETPSPIGTLNPDIPAWLVRIIGRLHAKDPDDRYGSAAEVANLLGRCLAHVQQPSTVSLPRELAEPPSRRGSVVRYAVAACALVGILVVLVGGRGVAEQVVDYVATVLRIKTPEGILVIETSDPNVAIKVDGNDLVVTGAGLKELRLPVGPHSIRAVQGRTTLLDELVTITRGGRKTLSVRREDEAPTAKVGLSPGEASARENAAARTAQTAVPTNGVDGPYVNLERTRNASMMVVTMRMTPRKPAPENPTGAVLSRNPPDKPGDVAKANLAPLDVFSWNASEVRTLAFSPDGRTLASGAKNGSLLLWEITPAGVATGCSQFVGHFDAIESVAFSPDGKTLVSGGWDHHVNLWDVSRGAADIKHLWRWEGTSDGGRPVAFSPDGKKVALGSFDGFATILNAATGSQLWATSAPARPVNGLAYSPDGKLLALALGDKLKNTIGGARGRPGEVQIWETTGRALRVKLGGGTRGFKSVAFSPDGKHLAASNGDGTTRLFDMATSQLKAEWRGKPLAGLAFRPDGKILAEMGRAGSVNFWDPDTTHRRATLQGAHDQDLSALAFAPDGRILATAAADGSIRLWDVSEPSPRPD